MIDDRRRGHDVSVVQPEPQFDPRTGGRGPLPGAARDRLLRGAVGEHFDFIWRSLRRFGLSPADADDAAQRVFLVFSQKLERVDVGRERAFLFGTAQRVAMEQRRARGRRPEGAEPELDPPDSAPNPEEATDQHRVRLLLDQVLESMPVEVRTVFVLFELEELSAPEIAQLLEVPTGTVASRLRRGRELFHAAAGRIRAREEFRGGTP